MFELVDMDLHLREHVAKKENYFSRSLCNQILGKFSIALGYKGEENLKNCIYGDIPIMKTIVEKASSHSETQPFISQTRYFSPTNLPSNVDCLVLACFVMLTVEFLFPKVSALMKKSRPLMLNYFKLYIEQ